MWIGINDLVSASIMFVMGGLSLWYLMKKEDVTDEEKEEILLHQYHVYNHHINIIVSIPIEQESYAKEFAKECAIDEFDCTEEQLEDIKVDYIMSYSGYSAINLNTLNKEHSGDSYD